MSQGLAIDVTMAEDFPKVALTSATLEQTPRTIGQMRGDRESGRRSNCTLTSHAKRMNNFGIWAWRCFGRGDVEVELKRDGGPN